MIDGKLVNGTFSPGPRRASAMSTIAGHTHASLAGLASLASVTASVLQHEVYREGPDLDAAIDLDQAAARHLARCFPHR